MLKDEEWLSSRVGPISAYLLKKIVLGFCMGNKEERS